MANVGDKVKGEEIGLEPGRVYVKAQCPTCPEPRYLLDGPRIDLRRSCRPCAIGMLKQSSKYGRAQYMARDTDGKVVY